VSAREYYKAQGSAERWEVLSLPLALKKFGRVEQVTFWPKRGQRARKEIRKIAEKIDS
jgi:hypothetical protein